MSNPLIIYHSSCSDGFASAWACHRAFGNVDLHPGHYGEDPPDVKNRRVYIVDFSYPRDVMERIHREAYSLRVFDHHKTAQSEMEGLNYCVFDMERSGASITWDELMGGSRPDIIRYVEDRDLWRFALPHSKHVSNRVQATPHTLQAWNNLNRMSLNDLKAQGAAIQLKIDSYCERAAATARVLNVFGIRVPVVNAQQDMISDLLEHLIYKQEDSTGVAVGWWQRHDGRYVYSLRSRDTEDSPAIDVSEIAKKYGGGGHKQAAGFQWHTPIDDLEEL